MYRPRKHKVSKTAGNFRISTGIGILDLSAPKVMGVLNLSPDSFYDGGKYNSVDEAYEHARKMLTEGADVIDIGAVSTRPGAKEVYTETEIERLIPVLKKISDHYPDAILSVDTYRQKVAEEAVNNGAHIINDISGGKFDEKMIPFIADRKIPYILMHIKGNPANMQDNPAYNNVVKELIDFFTLQINKLAELGMRNNFIIDPGFGFGKTIENNYDLLMNLKSFTALGHPVMAGLSRKSMINKVIGTRPGNALNGTSVLNTIALMNGACILRVHDVKEARETVQLVEFSKNFGQNI